MTTLKSRYTDYFMMQFFFSFSFSKQNYRQDVDSLLRRNEDVVDGLKQVPPPKKAVKSREEYMLRVVNGSFIMGAGTKAPEFSSSCREIYISGTNKYELVEAGAGAPFLFDGRLTEKGLVGPEVVRRVMQDARDQDLDFIRVNAFAVDDQFSAIVSYESGELIFNENILRGLDFVLHQAQAHGLKVLLVLTDYFSDRAGGPLEYMQ